MTTTLKRPTIHISRLEDHCQYAAKCESCEFLLGQRYGDGDRPCRGGIWLETPKFQTFLNGVPFTGTAVSDPETWKLPCAETIRMWFQDGYITRLEKYLDNGHCEVKLYDPPGLFLSKTLLVSAPAPPACPIIE